MVKLQPDQMATEREIAALTKVGGCNHIVQLLAVVTSHIPWDQTFLILPDLSQERINLRRNKLNSHQIASVMKQLLEVGITLQIWLIE